MVLNFYQLRNYTRFSFQLINSENVRDNYSVQPYETTARGDMWLAQGQGSKGVTILASCDGAPLHPLLHMWDHDWAIRYRIGGQASVHSIAVNGNKDFRIDVRDDDFTFVCNGTFTGSISSAAVVEWMDQLTYSFSDVVSDPATLSYADWFLETSRLVRRDATRDNIQEASSRQTREIMDLVASWIDDYLEHGQGQGNLVGPDNRGWRIDLQDNGPVTRRNMQFYNVAVQQGAGRDNVYAHVLIPVGYVIGRRRIRNALLESMRTRQVANIIPPGNDPNSGDPLRHHLLDGIPYNSDQARNSWAVRSIPWLCVAGSRVLR